MQRWIVIIALVLLLLGGGAVFGLWKFKQTRPDRIYVPLHFSTESTTEQRRQTADEMRSRLLTREILAAVARDTNVASAWNLGSEEAAVEELSKRAFVEVGEAPSPSGGRAPSLNVGFRGIRAENGMLRTLTDRLGEDLKKIIESERTSPQPGTTDF